MTQQISKQPEAKWVGGIVLLGAVVIASSFSLKVSTYPGTRTPNVACAEIWERKIGKHERLIEKRREIVTPALLQKGFGERTAYDPFEATYTCHAEHRRGKLFGDGGKFCCGDDDYFKAYAGPKGEKCLVYSVGSNGDATFETEIVASLGCEVHTFDPTGNSTKYANIVKSAGATFHSIGVSGTPGTVLNTVTNTHSQLLPIKDIMDTLGHTKRHLNILKIDCEVLQGFSATLHELEVGRPWLLDIPDLFLRYIPPHRIHSIKGKGRAYPYRYIHVTPSTNNLGDSQVTRRPLRVKS